MEEYYKRTVEDAKNMLIYAKQTEDDVNNVTQIFYYPLKANCENSKENFRLMLVDEDLIKKVENGERLVFKGSNEEKIVLCTENETFEVKEGEVSNSLILCPNLLYNSELKKCDRSERVLKEQMVLGVYHSYLELRLTFPRLQKLKTLLADAEYNGPDEEETHKGYYFGELLDFMQCSKNELIQHLKDIKACCIEDKWRSLGSTYLTHIFSLIMCYLSANNCNEVDAFKIKQHVPNVPEFIIDHILKYYTTPCERDPNLFMLKENLISKCFGETLLRAAEGKFRYNEFMKTWENYLHPIAKPNLDHLKGLVLLEKGEGNQSVFHLFPEDDLPENIPERFRLLFKRKPKWTLEEITPYIEKLATKTMNINTMLMKYTRSLNANGTRLFCARYAK